MKKRVSLKTLSIVVAILMGLNFGSLATQSFKHKREVKQLTQEYELLQERNNELVMQKAESESKVVNTIIQKIQEDKDNGVTLIVFESTPSSYSKTIKENAMFPVEKTLTTAFKYSAGLDMTGVIADRTEDGKVAVTFHKDMIDVFAVEKGEMKIDSPRNFVNGLKGSTRDKINQELLSIAEQEIQMEVTSDFSDRKDSIMESILEVLATNYGVETKNLNVTILGE